MIQERLEAACWAAELRRRGTLLSDQAVAEVCEALLELAGEGTITLELHERVMAERTEQRDELLRSTEKALGDVRAEVVRLEALRLQGVAMGQAANRRIEELERWLADTEGRRKAECEHANRWAARAHAAEAELHRLKTLEGSP